ncbi:LPXTG cell wall anchor domain-containing protein [Planococcus lenghuensis]|uniref:Gram-positive cocci surface proteins LPxTG domain-containing protein n=1 Tax=Planococcus lenghuensis TaxID=2213202 RepID=A0A1Q2KV48_9BACL|nr:LPXTG cell wall anchor domain-containing protein [Planococcus lenghuensis]AQQ52023.1 hypothetical protein B0X71_02060 [Planococcus lenghuensis]
MKNKLTAWLIGSFLALGFATGVSADNHIEDTLNCGDFEGDTEGLVELWYENDFDAENDPHNLDGDADGLPCEVLQADFDAYAAEQEAGTDTEDPVEGTTDEEETDEDAASEDTEDTVTNDRDCDYFATHEDALDFWFTNGYSADNDPHRLDGDDDGIPCEVTADEYDAFVADWNDDEEGNEEEEAIDENEATDEDEAAADEDEEEGEPLPDTATSNPLMMLFGTAIAGAGALLMLRRKEGKTQA